jgi:hypothetical protein
MCLSHLPTPARPPCRHLHAHLPTPARPPADTYTPTCLQLHTNFLATARSPAGNCTLACWQLHRLKTRNVSDFPSRSPLHDFKLWLDNPNASKKSGAAAVARKPGAGLLKRSVPTSSLLPKKKKEKKDRF